MIQRRLFLGGLLGAAAAPAIVRASSLMKVAPAAVVEPALWLPRSGGQSSRHTYNSIWLQATAASSPVLSGGRADDWGSNFTNYDRVALSDGWTWTALP